MTTFKPEEIGGVLRGRFIVGMRRAVLRGLKRGTGRARAPIVRAIEASPFGKSLIGGGKKSRKRVGLRAQIRVMRAKQTGDDAFECGIKLSGLAALIDQGGRTNPHEISAGGDGILSFIATDGSWVRSKIVKHPGGPVSAVRAALPSIEAARSGIAAEIDKDLQKAVVEADLG